MSFEQTSETIDDYLKGELSGPALTSFQDRLKTDFALAREVELTRGLFAAIADESTLSFQKLVARQGNAYLANRKVNGQGIMRALPGTKRQWYAVAAAVAAIVVTVTLLNRGGGATESGADLFAAYHAPFEVSDQFRRGEDPAVGPNKGVQLYRAGDFAAAAEVWQAQLPEKSGDFSFLLALGNAYLNQTPADLDKANDMFQRIIDHGLSPLVPKAKWYAALVSIQKEDFATATPLLESVAASGDQEVASLAKELLKEIK